MFYMNCLPWVQFGFSKLPFLLPGFRVVSFILLHPARRFSPQCSVTIGQTPRTRAFPPSPSAVSEAVNNFQGYSPPTPPVGIPRGPRSKDLGKLRGQDVHLRVVPKAAPSQVQLVHVPTADCGPAVGGYCLGAHQGHGRFSDELDFSHSLGEEKEKAVSREGDGRVKQWGGCGGRVREGPVRMATLWRGSAVSFPVSGETLRNFVPSAPLNHLPVLSLSPEVLLLRNSAQAAGLLKPLCLWVFGLPFGSTTKWLNKWRVSRVVTIAIPIVTSKCHAHSSCKCSGSVLLALPISQVSVLGFGPDSLRF